MSEHKRLDALARMMAFADTQGATETRLRLAKELEAAAGTSGEAAMLARTALSDGVHPLHFLIVQDAIRNNAYDQALRRAVKPGMRVLDIGTGTGLLAMMAARAGAAKVFACEAVPATAAGARQIIQGNRLAEQVQVIVKRSFDLDMERDLGGPVDLIVSEIIDNDIISAGTLDILEDAQRLLKPGGRMLPPRMQVQVGLVEDTKFHNRRMQMVSGFDLGSFNSYAKPHYLMKTGLGALKLRSNTGTLFTFDFPAESATPARSECSVTARAGTANAVAQWIRLELDNETSYENAPDCGFRSCWAAMVWPLPEPIQLTGGEQICISGEHDRKRVRVWKA